MKKLSILLAALIIGLWAHLWPQEISAASSAKAEISPEILKNVFPQADRFGLEDGNPPAIPAYSNDELIGYVFSSRKVAGTTGFSGKPLDFVIGVDRDAKIAGVHLQEHHEPILVIGVEDADLHRHIGQYIGLNATDLVSAGVTSIFAGSAGDTHGLDGITGASITTAVFNDTIMRSSKIIARSRGFILDSAEGEESLVDYDRFRPLTWPALLDEGVVVKLSLSNRDVAAAFKEQGISKEVLAEFSAAPDSAFIDLYAALATPALIGRNLFGDHLFNKLSSQFDPDDEILFVAANGRFSFKGTSWVRSGLFDRLQLVQGGRTIRLTGDMHRRLDNLQVKGGDDFRETALFVLPSSVGFNPAEPWRLELLIPRAYENEAGATRHAFAEFTLPYQLPAEIDRSGVKNAEDSASQTPLWKKVWFEARWKVVILLAALLLLLTALVIQDLIERRPKVYRAFRLSFLCFTAIWIGWYAGAQLSVLNVITFVQSLLTGFHWEFFLLGPLIFILWSFVAVALLFWGRGVYCGWLCPFGALQELLNEVARAFRVPQLRIPFAIHERLWPIKYILFLALLGLSFYSVRETVILGEAEPFKTVYSLTFNREWGFVLYAVGLLAIGLFIERFYCRYLCPLGGALAIPARMRMFEWLKRRPQCGRECHICAQHCTVDAIHPDGHINPNECIYCMNCQIIYYNDHVCPPVMRRRERHEAYKEAHDGVVSGDQDKGP